MRMEKHLPDTTGEPDRNQEKMSVDYCVLVAFVMVAKRGWKSAAGTQLSLDEGSAAGGAAAAAAPAARDPVINLRWASTKRIDQQKALGREILKELEEHCGLEAKHLPGQRSSGDRLGHGR